MKKLLVLLTIIALPFSALAAGLTTVQGGTGTTSPSGLLYGDSGSTLHLNSAKIGSGLLFTGGTLSATGGSSPFSWTPTSYGNSTSTTLGFLNGLLSNASSTFNGNTYFPSGIWNSSGSVGVGTTLPQRLLSVSGSAASSVALGGANPAIVVTNTSLASLNTKAELQLSLNGFGSAVVSGQYEKFNGVGDIGTALIFGTQTNLAGGNVERMRINYLGNVGIGTITPGSLLSISGVAPTFTINDTRNQSPAVGTVVADIQFKSDDLSNALNGTTRGSIGLVSEFNNTGAYTGLAFSTHNGTTLGERMRIDNSGNVGIGTTTPVQALTIAGKVGFFGTIPTLSSCGTSPSITKGSTDVAGEVTEGTVATACTVTFATARTNAPFCTVTNESGLAFSYAVSTSAIVITNIGALSGTATTYNCIDNNK